MRLYYILQIHHFTRQTSKSSKSWTQNLDSKMYFYLSLSIGILKFSGLFINQDPSIELQEAPNCLIEHPSLKKIWTLTSLNRHMDLDK